MAAFDAPRSMSKAMKACWCLPLLLLWTPRQSLAAPPPGDVFTADYSSDMGNWETELDGNYVSGARAVAGGPYLLDAYAVAFLPTSDVQQPYLGHLINTL